MTSMERLRKTKKELPIFTEIIIIIFYCYPQRKQLDIHVPSTVDKNAHTKPSTAIITWRKRDFEEVFRNPFC